MMNDPSRTGVPVLVGPEGAQPLERVPLTSEGKGTFDEAWLQQLIHRNPACLPIGEIEPGLDSFAAICREMPIPGRGYVDNLLMTGAGDIAIVETKLFRNPEARRQAVAQALDYATALFEMSYEAFEKAVLAGVFDGSKPKSLHAALPEADKLDEAAFVDAVAINLRRGRALVLVAGDGIRAETEALVDGLHAYAGYGFTLALVELGVFQMPGEVGRFLVRPRTLAKTAIVQRTIVEVTGAGATVREERLAVPETLHVNAYWQALEAKVPGARAALERLIRAGERFGIYPEFLKSVNLKWDRPGGKSVNLGYVYKYTSLWTDVAASSVPRDLAHSYVEDLATAFGCDVYTLPTSGNWTLYKQGKPLRLDAVLNRLDVWLPPMQRFIAAIQRHDAEAGSFEVRPRDLHAK